MVWMAVKQKVSASLSGRYRPTLQLMLRMLVMKTSAAVLHDVTNQQRSSHRIVGQFILGGKSVY